MEVVWAEPDGAWYALVEQLNDDDIQQGSLMHDSLAELLEILESQARILPPHPTKTRWPSITTKQRLPTAAHASEPADAWHTELGKRHSEIYLRRQVDVIARVPVRSVDDDSIDLGPRYAHCRSFLLFAPRPRRRTDCLQLAGRRRRVPCRGGCLAGSTSGATCRRGLTELLSTLYFDSSRSGPSFAQARRR